MRTSNTLRASLILLALMIGGMRSADADEHRDHERHEEGYRGHEWHGDIRHFHEHDIDLWRGGRWYQGRHEGRFGWWWIVGGAYYFYPQAVYPYPDPYQPPVLALPAPTVVTPPAYLYYCSNPTGYYPYVARCLQPWTRVLSETQQAEPGQGVPPPGVGPR